MKPLTLEHALENKFTGIGCVKYFNPEMSDEEADYIIWNETCFPFSNEKMIDQLNEKFPSKDERTTH